MNKYIIKGNYTYASLKVEKGDVILIYNYDKDKKYSYEVIRIECHNKKEDWRVEKELIDYIIELKLKGGEGMVSYRTPVLKSGEVYSQLKRTCSPVCSIQELMMVTKYFGCNE